MAITGLSYAGNIFGQDAAAYSETVSALVSDTGTPGGPYTDGVYTGSASGYKGTTTVSATVENGYISDVEVLSTDDDRAFFSRAESSVIASILSQQSTQVDAVSGATFSSRGILEAVANALGWEYENSNSAFAGQGQHGGHSGRF